MKKIDDHLSKMISKRLNKPVRVKPADDTDPIVRDTYRLRRIDDAD